MSRHYGDVLGALSHLWANVAFVPVRDQVAVTPGRASNHSKCSSGSASYQGRRSLEQLSAARYVAGGAARRPVLRGTLWAQSNRREIQTYRPSAQGRTRTDVQVPGLLAGLTPREGGPRAAGARARGKALCRRGTLDRPGGVDGCQRGRTRRLDQRAAGAHESPGRAAGARNRPGQAPACWSCSGRPTPRACHGRPGSAT